MVLDFSPLEFDELQKDALAEAGTISLGSAATALSQLVNKEVRITAPMVTLTSMEKVRSNYPIPCLVLFFPIFRKSHSFIFFASSFLFLPSIFRY